MNDTMTSAACTAAAQKLCELFEVVRLPVFKEPDYSDKAWLTKVDNPLPSGSNIGLRGKNGGLDAFGVRVCSLDNPNRVPLHELESYRFLCGLGNALSFETETTAVFVFKRDPRFVEVSEHGFGHFDKIHTGSLKDCRLVTSWLGYGVVHCDGKPCPVSCEGQLLDCREFPSLIEALGMSGRFKVLTW